MPLHPTLQKSFLQNFMNFFFIRLGTFSTKPNILLVRFLQKVSLQNFCFCFCVFFVVFFVVFFIVFFIVFFVVFFIVYCFILKYYIFFTTCVKTFSSKFYSHFQYKIMITPDGNLKEHEPKEQEPKEPQPQNKILDDNQVEVDQNVKTEGNLTLIYFCSCFCFSAP